MNIGDVAKMAGVSKAAVSRYFNNGYISEEKKEKIREVVEKTGYRPSLQAQTLRTKRTKLIGVILPKIDSYSMGSEVEGILKVLNERGYYLMLANTENNVEKETEYLEMMNNRQVDGVILVATVLTEAHQKILRKMDKPYVVVGQRDHESHCVCHDDYHAMYDMTKYVIGQGRKKLGYIGVFQQDKAVGQDRQRGFLNAAADLGISLNDDQVIISDFTIPSGYEMMGKLLERNADIDAVICATDRIAVGALHYLKDHNIRVPDQIMISGQGDSDLARYSSPSITTIRYPYEESGETAARMLLNQVEGENNGIRQMTMGYQLILQESTTEQEA